MPKLNWNARLCLYAITAVVGSLSILNTVFSLMGEIGGIVIYVLSALLLAASVFYLIPDFRLAYANMIHAIEACVFTAHLRGDYNYRSLICSIPSTGIVAVFAIFSGVIGIYSNSLWYGSLAFYYLLLSIMRSMILYRQWLEKTKAQTELQKLQACRFCGIRLSVMTLALNISAALMLGAGNTKHYPGVLIYAVAAYTFYKVIMSVINMIRAGKSNHVYVSALRYIGHADALVSLLSLQTAMFAAFGSENGRMVTVMNALTGLVVCGAVLTLGIQLIVKSQKRMQHCKEELP